ncbi:hypothetical protein OKW38_007687 [Paraburkholderia sp. MM5496-R1]|uniref:hypothetical protein n=1 Tax=Paraburkholderia sp. MM5496-R1 TaxID=2991065 RepID=UPI003D1B49FF
MKALSAFIAVMRIESETTPTKYFRHSTTQLKLSGWLLESRFTTPRCANVPFTYNPLEKRREGFSIFSTFFPAFRRVAILHRKMHSNYIRKTGIRALKRFSLPSCCPHLKAPDVKPYAAWRYPGCQSEPTV